MRDRSLHTKNCPAVFYVSWHMRRRRLQHSRVALRSLTAGPSPRLDDVLHAKNLSQRLPLKREDWAGSFRSARRDRERGEAN